MPLKAEFSPPPIPARKLFPKRYLRVVWKFWIGHAIALGWLIFSIFLSIHWVQDLSRITGMPLALLIIVGLAYIPGYLNAFLVASLVLDRQPRLAMDDPTEPITILIAARNEEANIQETLNYITNQNYSGPIRVIVIDNGSTDRTSEIAASIGAELGLDMEVLSEPRPGKHFALNTGLAHVDTPSTITLDADTLLHPSAIRFLVARLMNSPANVCAVAGSVLVRNSRVSFWTRLQEWDYFLGIASIKRLQGLYQGTLVAQGAFSLYRTRSLKAIGGWPDVIGEDIVLTWLFLQRGWRVYYEPLAVSFTSVPDQLRHFVRQRNRWARGMIEGLKNVKPWQQPRIFTMFLTGVNLVMPFLDLVYTFFWLPGLVLALFGIYWIVGPLTLLVIPLTLVSNALLYLFQRRYVFRTLDLRVRRNWRGFFSYVLLNQMVMSPVSVWGYLQEILNLRRVWK
ncbi:glycosyltransferase family 2 protein [Paenibacillus cremeus]|uniref:Glycosyltransferase family 2 protein n=1 Tax=Paenibacillus cremeus TaxID=2163881 RepID=A0A559JIG7_9BACL|nr:glycosyltransferase [Paenibacillus cremeus]TVX99661.1 glycosyltransferase family 2 protein [Paenibacillus cremeus]